MHKAKAGRQRWRARAFSSSSVSSKKYRHAAKARSRTASSFSGMRKQLNPYLERRVRCFMRAKVRHTQNCAPADRRDGRQTMLLLSQNGFHRRPRTAHSYHFIVPFASLRPEAALRSFLCSTRLHQSWWSVPRCACSSLWPASHVYSSEIASYGRFACARALPSHPAESSCLQASTQAELTGLLSRRDPEARTPAPSLRMIAVSHTRTLAGIYVPPWIECSAWVRRRSSASRA